jgi:hypothetical protein
VSPIKKKKKRRISDSEDDDDFTDRVPKKKEKSSSSKPKSSGSDDVKKSTKKSEESTTTTSTTTATTTTASESKPEKRKEERSSDDRQHKKDKDRHSSKSVRDKPRDKERDEEKEKRKKEEKRKSVSAPVTPLKSSSGIHRPSEHRKTGDEITFKLAQSTNSASNVTAPSNGVLSSDSSTEAIKKILNGDRVVGSSPSKSLVKPSPNKMSPFKMSSSLTSGAHVERVKLFPRPIHHHGSDPAKPATPKKIVEFSSTANQNNSLDLLGSIMSDMNSAMKK